MQKAFLALVALVFIAYSQEQQSQVISMSPKRSIVPVTLSEGVGWLDDGETKTAFLIDHETGQSWIFIFDSKTKEAKWMPTKIMPPPMPRKPE